MRTYFPIVILLGCVAVFAFGVAQLFEWRFESGDVYPPYSSLRSDPLGAMAFYESLGRVTGLATSRDFSDSSRLPEEPDTVYLQFGGSPDDWRWLPEDVNQDIKGFLAGGGRLVIAFSPEMETSLGRDQDQEDITNSVKSVRQKVKDGKAAPAKPAKKKKKKKQDEDLGVSLADAWGVHQGYEELARDGDNFVPIQVKNRTDTTLPHSLAWHSGLVFTNCAAAWRTIYARGHKAVMIERYFGKGSIVMAGDSYFVSNEAMTKERHADLLLWLIGGHRNIVFDESHFGILNTSGVATLTRKYHLHGLVAGLILLAGLYIWKNATSLLPPQADEASDGVVAGKDAGAGFVNLLRRSIAPRDLLAACFAEWKKSGPATGKFSTGRLKQAEAIFQAENSAPVSARNAVAAYHDISEALGNRKPKS